MKSSDLLSLSTRMFKTRPMRTFLTVLGVGVGIGTVLFLVSLGYGLQNIILNRIATADSLLTLDVSPGPSDELKLNDGMIKDLHTMPQVQEISRLKNFQSQMTLNDLTTSALVQAVDPSFLRLKGVRPEAGGMLLTDGSGSEFNTVISSAAVQLFNLDPSTIIGKKIDITLALPTGTGSDASAEVTPLPHAYTIVGIVDDQDTSYVYIPLAGIDGMGNGPFDQIKIKVHSNDQMESVRDAVLAKGLIVSALSDTIDQANKIFRVVQIVLALFGFVALVVSAIGMFNTMTITLLERTNEIGIMRAIGITRFDIRLLFLFESMFMGFLGGLGGVLIGELAGVIANWAVNLLASRFGGASLDLFFTPWWFIVLIIGFSTFIGFVTGIYPSRRASKLNPLDALRYK